MVQPPASRGRNPFAGKFAPAQTPGSRHFLTGEKKFFGGSPVMFRTKSLTAAVFALGFIMAPPVLAAGPHAHDKPAAPVQLRLDHGKKWPTDDVLRRGMGDIRLAMAQSL